MKDIEYTLAISRFTGIILWIFIVFTFGPSWAASYCIENNIYTANEPAITTSSEEAVNIAKEYLDIDNTADYKIKIAETVITTDSFNAYKMLEPGISRLCWVVTIIAPNGVGAGRTVYVDKESGEILGGYSSK